MIKLNKLNKVQNLPCFALRADPKQAELATSNT